MSLGPQHTGALDKVRHSERAVSQAAEVVKMMERLHGLASDFSKISMALTVAANPAVIVSASARTVLTACPGSSPWER
jgi:hypothetical protein